MLRRSVFRPPPLHLAAPRPLVCPTPSYTTLSYNNTTATAATTAATATTSSAPAPSTTPTGQLLHRHSALLLLQQQRQRYSHFAQPFCATMTTHSRSQSTHSIPTTTTNIDALPLHASLPASVLPHGFKNVPPGHGLPAYTLFDHDIEKSQNDQRAYRVIRLENGLEALLIHDAKTDKAAASLSVNVGHLSDPEDLQGLAHFCEHLLFMGTEKFPRENEYSEFLSKNSGSSNAFTDMDDTNYFFDVHPSALDGALDRFAQFFIGPLFDPSCTEREIRAVDSEHKKNLQSDTWRLHQLDKSTSSRSHVYWRFGTGNLETLWDGPRRQGRDIRSELLDFHKRHYSANVMKLAVLGKEPLDELVRMVVSRFSGVLNADLQPPVFSGSPYTSEELKWSVYAKTVKDLRRLEMSFPFPDQGPLFDCKPGNFITHFVGHEGPGSILSVLKHKGWANELRAGVGGGTTGFDFFRVTIELTKEGLVRHKDVVKTVYAYLELLRKTPPEEWAFKEVAMLSEIDFRFKEDSQPSNYVMTLSGQMQRPFPRDKLLSAPLVVRKFDPELIRRTISELIPGQCRITLACQKHLDGIPFNLQEHWYGTEYSAIPVDPSLLHDFDYEGLALPKPNSFIPSNLNVDKIEVSEPARRPTWIKDTPVSTLWYKKDDRWWLPRAALYVKFRNPIIDSTVANSVKTRLFARLVEDALSEYSYDAELAGLGYTLETSEDTLSLTMEGYNDKLPVLARVILDKMRDLQIDPQRFDVIKDQLTRNLKNIALDPPYKHAGYWTTAVTTERFWTYEERSAILTSITAEDVQSFMKEIFSRLQIEMFIGGNIYRDQALAIAEAVESTFKPQPLTQLETRSRRALLIPSASNSAIIKPVPNPSNVNTGVEFFCFVGDVNDPILRCKVSLFAQLVDEPCFNQLRTKEQLGYVVASGSRKTIGSCGIRIVVQSERDGPYIEGRIEEFLKHNVTELLETMSDEDFEREKMSLVNKKLEDYKNGWEEVNGYWTHIRSGYYSFTQNLDDAELIKTLTKQDMIQFHQAFIHPDSPTRAKLSFHLQSQHAPIPKETLVQLAESLQSQGLLDVDTDTMTKLLESKPDLPTLKRFAETYLKDKHVSEEQMKQVMNMMDNVTRQVPSSPSSSSSSTLPSHVKVYHDWTEYKRQLQPGPYAVPADDYKKRLL